MTVYEVMGLPPLPGDPVELAGALKNTVASPLPLVTDNISGFPGTVEGVTLLEDWDAAPMPAAFVAVTLKV